MRHKGNIRQLGRKLGRWSHLGLKIFQFTTKPGQKTKIAEQPSLPSAFTKFANWAATTDMPAIISCAPTSLATAPITAPMASLPAGKLGEIVRLIGGDGGATIDDLTAVTDWQRHIVRAALCRLRQRGFVIMAKHHCGQTIYFLQKDQ